MNQPRARVKGASLAACGVLAMSCQHATVANPPKHQPALNPAPCPAARATGPSVEHGSRAASVAHPRGPEDVRPAIGRSATPSADGSARAGAQSRPEPARIDPVIFEEEEYVAQHFEELPPVTLLPDYLSINDVVALAPGDGYWDREELRRQIRTQLETRSGDALRGGEVDGEGKLYALWLSANGFESVLAIYDSERGSRRARLRVPARSSLMLADVLWDAGEKESVKELIVRVVEGTSICCLPVRWDVYRLSRWGSLSKVLSHAKEHLEVGPGVTYRELFHFDFDPKRGRVLIHSVLAEQPATFEFVYRTSSGRYRATAETLKLEAAASTAPEQAPRARRRSPARALTPEPDLSF